MDKLKTIIDNLKGADTPEGLDLATKAANTYFLNCPEIEKAELQKAITEKAMAVVLDANKAINEVKAYLKLNGAEYLLSDWVTLKEYCNRYHLKSTSVVSNWIARGVVPSENIIVVPEMNNLKLIKAVAYFG